MLTNPSCHVMGVQASVGEIIRILCKSKMLAICHNGKKSNYKE